MAGPELSNTILIINPVGENSLTALRAQHNNNRLTSIQFEDADSAVTSTVVVGSRESTPFIPRVPETVLLLKFDPEPLMPSQGFVFGRMEKTCDILLGRKAEYGISGQQFRINFNWTSGNVVLYNLSSRGTEISGPSVYNGRKILRKADSQHLLAGHQFKVYVGSLIFEIYFPNRGQYQREYITNWHRYHQKYKTDTGIDGLVLDSSSGSTVLVACHKGRRGGYFLLAEIGRGSSGVVYRASDDRYGEQFAAKLFGLKERGNLKELALKEIAMLERLTHVCAFPFKNVIRLLICSQEHIVSFIDFVEDDKAPLLVMEYCPLGNLLDQGPLSSEEMRLVLYQGLQALAYLHRNNITHRDIKPTNILVRSRTPRIHVKLCDLGLSTEESCMQTFCGTRQYLAPEVCTGFYTSAVDIWAIGIVGLEGMTGLPKQMKFWDVEGWAGRVRQWVDEQGDDPKLSLIKDMLRLEPTDRLSAEQCLSHDWIQTALPVSHSQNKLFVESTSEESTLRIDHLPRKRPRSQESTSTKMGTSKKAATIVAPQGDPNSSICKRLAEGTDEHNYDVNETTDTDVHQHTSPESTGTVVQDVTGQNGQIRVKQGSSTRCW